MTERFQWGVISDDKTESTEELLALDSRIEEQQREKEKALAKLKEKENPNATLEAYRAAHWFCDVQCGFKVDRRNEGAIQEHKSKCGYQIEKREEKKKIEELKYEGHSRMRYILHVIQSAKEDVETKNRIIADQKEKLAEATQRKNKLQEVTYGLLEEGDNLLEKHDKVIRTRQHEIELAERDLSRAQYTIEKEQVEKHKLLNHSNEIVRTAAKEIHDQFLKMSAAERRRRFLY